jgi:hypothetical protein
MERFKRVTKKEDPKDVSLLFKDFSIYFEKRYTNCHPKLTKILDKEKPDLIFADMFMGFVIEEANKREIKTVALYMCALGVLGFQDRLYLPDFFNLPNSLERSTSFGAR